MTKFFGMALACAVALASAAPALAHHSSAAFDTREDMTVRGTIIEVTYRNPHVYMVLDVERDDGTRGEMEVEAGAASVLRPLGFTRESVAAGDVVTIAGNPGRRNPAELMLGRELFKADGSYYPLNISSRSIYEPSDESASGIAGTWFSPPDVLFRVPGRRWRVAADRSGTGGPGQHQPDGDAAEGLRAYRGAGTDVLSRGQHDHRRG